MFIRIFHVSSLFADYFAKPRIRLKYDDHCKAFLLEIILIAKKKRQFLGVKRNDFVIEFGYIEE